MMHGFQPPPRAIYLSTLASFGSVLACSVLACSVLACSGSAGPGDGDGSVGGSGAAATAGVGASAGSDVGSSAGVSNAGTGGSTEVAGGGGGETSGGNAGTAGTSGGTAGADIGVSCAGAEQPASKRIVRLSFNQIANSIGGLIDSSLTSQLAVDNAILDSKHRAFPPLQSPREGSIVTDGQWTTLDAMASAAGEYVAENFDAVTGCGAEPTDACATDYLSTLARRAYRRPLTSDEQERVEGLYTTLKNDDGGTVMEAVQYGVYAILQAPQFTYRTELGDDWAVDGRLTQHELASAISYFLTDDLPDQELLDAAASDQLLTAEQIEAQVDRILLTPAAKANLQDAMTSYFNYQALENIVIQDPSFTDGVAASMYHEGELFLERTLWGDDLNELLLSTESVVNESLAEIYGISPFPAPGAPVDDDGFSPVQLPDNRIGIMTMPGFLSTRSRPTSTSIVGRGLLIKNAFLCTDTPPPPDSIADAIAELEEEQVDETDREQSIYRQTTSPCSGCHSSFDQYGVAVDNYDLIGRFRDVDDKGRAIDTSVDLPTQIGGGQASDIVEVAHRISESGVFAQCMGRNLINYALADTSAGQVELNSCSTQRVADAYAASSEQSFSSLVRSVAASAPFATRSKGADQ